MKTFIENLGLDTTSHVSGNQDGLSYLSWVNALILAGRPAHEVKFFNGKPCLAVFDGAIVGVSIGDQVTWLPVMDQRNNSIKAENVNSRIINDSIQRCRVKAIAMTTGIGLSLYADFGGDGPRFVSELGITGDTDISLIQPMSIARLDEADGSGDFVYLNWASALAAVKITDPAFFWEVNFFPSENPNAQQKPYLRISDTFMVSVNVKYKGVTHTEMLPIMSDIDFRAKTEPTSFDWNYSVMRCLTKAIAIVSGYGLSVYADEISLPVDAPEKAPHPGEDIGWSGNKPAEPVDLTDVRKLIAESQQDESSLCTWLGVKSLENADKGSIEKVKLVLKKIIRQMREGTPAPTEATPG